MFRTRISSSFARIFRFRIRCPAKENASSLVSSQPEPNDTNSTVHTHPLSTHTCANDALAPSPAPTHIIIIGREQDTTQITSPLSPEPILSDDVVSPDGLLPAESQPTGNTHHMFFQAPPTCTGPSPSVAPESPCDHVAHAAEVEMETGRTVPPEITITSPTPAPDCDVAAEHTPRSSLAIADAEVNAPPYYSDKARHRSLFVPQPVRANSVRFSMPARPTASRVTIETGDARVSTEQSKRTSLLPIGPAGTGWRKKRHSSEMNKRETQEVL